MARWNERRGFTLQLGPPDDAAGSEREAEPGRRQLVRLSLVERRGLTGRWFNVREARAETHDLGSMPSLTGGRTLSWRWLVESEAERLLDQRLRTLQALSYSIVDAEVASSHRGRWDWLYELVRRGLQPDPSRADEGAGDTTPAHEPSTALRDALERLGLSPEAITEGIATVLSLSPERLREPDGSTVAQVDPEKLGVLLPFLVEHRHPEIRAIGERWLDCPGAAFQLRVATVERWLSEAGRMGDLLAPRIRSEGLALLGPDALARLSKVSVRAPVRADATHWLRRLE